MFWSKILVDHLIDIMKHVIGRQIHVKAWTFQCEIDYQPKGTLIVKMSHHFAPNMVLFKGIM